MRQHPATEQAGGLPTLTARSALSLSSDQLSSVAELGLVAAAPSADAADRVLVVLRDLFCCDAVSLIARNPPGFRCVAALDYPAGTAEAMARCFPDSQWMPLVCASPLPPSISTEPDQTFRRGWIYEEIIRPAGFGDGMSAPLRRDGRVVGLVHLSSQRPKAFDERSQLLLRALLRPLEAVLDPLAGVVGRDEWAALIGPNNSVLAVGGQGRPPPLDDPRMPALLDSFRDSRATQLAFLLRHAGVWWRVQLATDTRAGPHAITLSTVRRDLPHGLTEREVEVLTLVATGATDEEISRRLCLSPRTVHTHLQHILRKTGQRRRVGAAVLALREGILLLTPETIRALHPPR